MHHPGSALKKLIDAHLSEPEDLLSRASGIIETPGHQMAVQPTEEMLQRSLVVMTNGYPQSM